MIVSLARYAIFHL